MRHHVLQTLMVRVAETLTHREPIGFRGSAEAVEVALRSVLRRVIARMKERSKTSEMLWDLFNQLGQYL
jgi:hypothetical protein